MRIAHFRIENDGTVIEQSIKEHLEGTADLSESFASKIRMSKTGKLAGILHDSGKYSDDYQSYLEFCRQYELGNVDRPPQKGSVDHGIFGAAYVMEELYPEQDGNGKIMAEILAMVLAYHHGGLKDYLGPDVSTPLWDRIRHYRKYKQEEYTTVKTQFEKEISPEWIQKLFTDASDELKELKISVSGFDRFQLHLTVKFLYSCLIDADREDTRCFMENVIRTEQSIDWSIYEERLEEYLRKLRDQPAGTESEEKIRHLREEISEACYQAGDWPSGIYKMTVPTGGGKTLASMRMALRHIQKKQDAVHTGHIIQVLPMVSIIEQNAGAVREVLKCGEDVLEHHSNVVLEQEGTEENNLSREQYHLLAERWNAPVIFTTMVQFLNTVYASGTQSMRRMHNLANAVIIMDEVQALPLKTTKLFGKLIEFLHHVCSTTIILCTATQPNLEKLKIGIGTEVREIIPDVMEKFAQFRRMEVKDAIKDGGYTIEEAAAYIQEVKKEVNSVLAIMNTKRITKDIYECLKKSVSSQIELLYISTDLCPAHRAEVIRRLKELLDQKKPVICVSTSILEAGVDISVESVVRNVAGLDSIAQSAGRGNRHGESEKPGFIHIINVKGESLGSMQEIITGEEKTKAVLDTYRRMPEAYDNSLLSPRAMTDYYQKYHYAEPIREQMAYPLTDDPELKSLYMYFTRDGSKILRRRYQGKVKDGSYAYGLTFPFETAGKKFRVIDQHTVSILVPYGKGREWIENISGRGQRYNVKELRQWLQKAKPYFVSLYTEKIRLYQEAVVSSPVPGILILREGYYDEETGIKEEKTLEFLSF